MNITKELASLQQMTVGELQDRYVEVFGEAVRSRHKQYLIRPIEIGPWIRSPPPFITSDRMDRNRAASSSF